MNIRTKLYLIFMSIAFSFIFIMIYVNISMYKKIAFESSLTRAEFAVELIGDLSLKYIDSNEISHLRELMPFISHIQDLTYLHILDIKGNTLFMYASTDIKLTERRVDSSVYKVEDGIFDIEKDLVNNNRFYGKLQLGIPINSVKENIEIFFWREIFWGGVFLSILAIFLWVASSKLAGDMQMLGDVMGKINDTRMPLLPDSASSSDVGKISAAFKGFLNTIYEEKNIRRNTEELSRDFFAMTVHDLKQPITVLKAAIQLMLEDTLKKSSDGKKELGHVSLAKYSLDRLNGMVEDILNITKLSDRDIPIQKKRIALKSLIKEIVLENSIIVSYADRKWRMEVTPEINDCYIYGDDVLIRRLIGNLVLNAINYTPEGGEIKFGARLSGNDSVELFVSDNGIGISEHFRKEIFKKYITLSKTAKNMGLGLAFCKLVADRHSARIGVRSEEGKGTEIFFTIPAS